MNFNGFLTMFIQRVRALHTLALITFVSHLFYHGKIFKKRL